MEPLEEGPFIIRQYSHSSVEPAVHLQLPEAGWGFG